MPVDGPAYRDIQRGATASLSKRQDFLIHTGRDNADFSYALVDISPNIIDVLDHISPDSFFGTFGRSRGSVPVIRVGVGDVLQTSVFESASGGLFGAGEQSTKGGNFVTFPSQTVTGSGTISIPYAGTIPAAGRTIPEIQRDVESKLASRAIEPQVIISVVEQNAETVTVIGDTGSNKIKITGSGERILDMISKSGGAGSSTGKFAGYELYVTLQRKNRTVTVPFTQLVDEPRENIYAAPGDIIYVFRQPKTFTAIGALAAVGTGAVTEGGATTGLSGQFRFEQERLSLNEAIAKAGGLTDSRANPAQVFLYRPERRETVEKMGVDLSNFPPAQRIIPTVYRANFRDPSNFFFVQKFQMRDKDIVYAANSDSIEITKFLNYVNTWTSTASNAMVDGRTIGDVTSGAHVLSNTSAIVVP
jgi:polysaccharide export outer membrane protein